MYSSSITANISKQENTSFEDEFSQGTKYAEAVLVSPMLDFRSRSIEKTIVLGKLYDRKEVHPKLEDLFNTSLFYG